MPTAARRALLVLSAILGMLAGVIPAAATLQDVQRVAFIGDSFEEGYGAPVGEGYLDLFEAWQLGDQVLPLAHGGATVRRWLSGGPWHPELVQLTAWAPATVVIPLGTNDWYIARPPAEYKAELAALIGEVRARVPGVRVILYHHLGGYVAPNPAACDDVPGWPPCVHQQPPATWGAYGAAMRAVAVEQGAGYIDDSTAYPWHLHLYDGLHPDITGHDWLFRSLYNRLYHCC